MLTIKGCEAFNWISDWIRIAIQLPHILIRMRKLISELKDLIKLCSGYPFIVLATKKEVIIGNPFVNLSA